MSSKQQPIRKHQGGGGGGGPQGGGHSQSNQRSSDYNRQQNDNNYSRHRQPANNVIAHNLHQQSIPGQLPGQPQAATAAATTAAILQQQMMRFPNQNPQLLAQQAAAAAAIQISHVNSNPQQQQQQSQTTPQGIPQQIINAHPHQHHQQRFNHANTAQFLQQNPQHQRIHSNQPTPQQQQQQRGGGGGGGGGQPTPTIAYNLRPHHPTIPTQHAAVNPSVQNFQPQNYPFPTHHHHQGYNSHHFQPGNFQVYQNANLYFQQFPMSPVMYYTTTQDANHLNPYNKAYYQQATLAPGATNPADLNNTAQQQYLKQQQHPQQQQQQNDNSGGTGVVVGGAGQTPQQQQQQQQSISTQPHHLQQVPPQHHPHHHHHHPIARKEKRERNPVDIYDDNGVKIDLEKLSQTKPAPTTTNTTSDNKQQQQAQPPPQINDKTSSVVENKLTESSTTTPATTTTIQQNGANNNNNNKQSESIDLSSSINEDEKDNVINNNSNSNSNVIVVENDKISSSSTTTTATTTPTIDDSNQINNNKNVASVVLDENSSNTSLSSSCDIVVENNNNSNNNNNVQLSSPTKTENVAIDDVDNNNLNEIIKKVEQIDLKKSENNEISNSQNVAVDNNNVEMVVDNNNTETAVANKIEIVKEIQPNVTADVVTDETATAAEQQQQPTQITSSSSCSSTPSRDDNNEIKLENVVEQEQELDDNNTRSTIVDGDIVLVDKIDSELEPGSKSSTSDLMENNNKIESNTTVSSFENNNNVVENDDVKLESVNDNNVEDGEDSIINDENINNNNKNENGKNSSLQYDRDFIVSRRSFASECALTNSNPDNIKDIIRKDSNSMNPSDSLLPSYAKMNRSMNDSQQYHRNKPLLNQTFRRPSQNQSRNYSDNKPRKIASTSLHDHHQQNNFNDDAWRPGKINSTDPEEIETENLIKTVRSILNKLTPQNYQTLLDQFKKLKIDSKSRLQRIIDLIFDKAVREPAFVVQYAGFCSELIHIKVTEENEKNENVQVKFKNLLIEKCQNTFYGKIYDNKIQELLNQAEETEDPQKKKELDDLIDYEKRALRKRSVGNIKLIAELYKLNMLNAKIMFGCLEYLLKDNGSCEEYIECLCALVTNIGKNLTDAIRYKIPDHAQKFKMVFEELEKIYNQEHELKVSSRIRFMILDLLDLRKNDWVPRRKTEGPKMIAQVHEDFEMQQRLKNESLNESLKKKKNPGQQQQQQQQQDDWQQVNKRKSHTGVANKNLNHLLVLKDISETNSRTTGGGGGLASIFKMGSHGGSTSNSQSRSSSTTYETSKNHSMFSSQNDRLSNQPPRAYHDSLNARNQSSLNNSTNSNNSTMLRRSGSGDDNSSNSRNSSLTGFKDLNQNQSSNNLMKRSDSSHSQLFNSSSRSDSLDRFKSSTNTAAASNNTGAAGASSQLPQLSDTEFLKKVTSAVQKSFDSETNDCCSEFSDILKFINQFCSRTKYADFISTSILLSIEKTSHDYNPREKWGRFLGKFLLESNIRNTDFFEGLKQVFNQYEDYKLDIPKYFEFIGEVIGFALLQNYKENPNGKQEIIKTIGESYNEISGNECQLFREALFSTVGKVDPNLLKEIKPLFQSNSKQSEKFKLDDLIDNYLKNMDLNELKNEIEKNYSESISNEDFKSALYSTLLSRAFMSDHYTTEKLNTIQILDKIKNFIKEFVVEQNDQVLFLIECSYLHQNMNHPQNLLLEIFGYLRDNKLVDDNSFKKWNSHKAPSTISKASVQRLLPSIK